VGTVLTPARPRRGETKQTQIINKIFFMTSAYHFMFVLLMTFSSKDLRHDFFFMTSGGERIFIQLAQRVTY